MHGLRLQDARRAIIFMVPGEDLVTGGIMSISSIASVTRQFYAGKDAAVFLSPAPGEPPLARYTRFNNSEVIVDLAWAMSKLHNCPRLIVHVPEIYVQRVILWMPEQGLDPSRVHINILLQNIEQAPTRAQVLALRSFGTISCTTAHAAYTTQATADELGCDLYPFSVWADHAGYRRTDFQSKRRLIVYSNDPHADKPRVLRALEESLPSYEFVEIKGMTYDEYLQLISQARYSITFGEGLDFYYVEPIYCGGIGCAIYNNKFFVEEFKSLDFIYASWDELILRFPLDVARCEDVSSYGAVNEASLRILKRLYSADEYKRNIQFFYKSIDALRESAVP